MSLHLVLNDDAALGEAQAMLCYWYSEPRSADDVWLDLQYSDCVLQMAQHHYQLRPAGFGGDFETEKRDFFWKVRGNSSPSCARGT